MIRILFLVSFLIMNNQIHAQNLFLIAGQSNATGQGDSLLSNQRISSLTFEYDVLTDAVKSLKDPAGQEWKLLQPANSGSIAPSFANTFSSLSNSKTIVITASRGGSSCCEKARLSNYDTWDTSGKLFFQTIEKTNKAINNTGLPLNGVIWMQGERDANSINDSVLNSVEFKNALKSLILRFKQNFGDSLPFYIVQTGYQSGRPKTGNDMVRKMQDEVTRELLNVFVVYSDTNLFFERNWMKDFVHYNQEGLNDIGSSAAKKIYSLMYK